MATLDDQDLKAIKDLMEVTIDEVIEKRELVTKNDLSHLPTKDDFYGKMDEVMGELKTIREEQSLQSQHLSDHDDNIQKIQSRLGMSSN
jgi:predicted nuclease with TOPRIM domain